MTLLRFKEVIKSAKIIIFTVRSLIQKIEILKIEEA